MEESMREEISTRLKEAEVLLKSFRADISRATRGGIPTGEMEKRYKELAEKVRLLRIAYGS